MPKPLALTTANDLQVADFIIAIRCPTTKGEKLQCIQNSKVLICVTCFLVSELVAFSIFIF